MSSMQSVILGLLEKSSLPRLYKSMVKNLLPNMSRVQQDDLFIILKQEEADKKVLHLNMTDTFWNFNSTFDMLKNDPSLYDDELAPILTSAEADSNKSASSKQLSNLKSKVALQKLRKKLK